MSTRQMLNEFISHIETSNIGENELFNMDMVVAKHRLFVYTSHLDAQQLKMIGEHLNSGVSVSLLMSKKVDESIKTQMGQDFFVKFETSKKWDVFMVIGYVIIAVGLIMLGISGYYHIIGNVINRQNEVFRLILPLLEVYLGFVIADLAFKGKYNRRPLNQQLEIGVFKRLRHLPRCYLYMTDDKRIIYQNIDSDKLGISHVKVIENPIVVEELKDIVENRLPLTKREGLTLAGLRSWLLG